MLFLIVGDKQESRIPHITKILEPLTMSEVLIYDDTHGTLADLEQYLYPSLFSIAPPVVHLKFMLGSDTEALTMPLLKKLLASPTIFVFEEIAVPTPLITLLKKAGAVVHEEKKVAALKKESDIFAATKALTAPDKKARWIAYRAALAEHNIEAIMGILYWKVRDLSAKLPKEKNRYDALYTKLLHAHAQAWESGAPLELLIEKVILTQ